MTTLSAKDLNPCISILLRNMEYPRSSTINYTLKPYKNEDSPREVFTFAVSFVTAIRHIDDSISVNSIKSKMIELILELLVHCVTRMVENSIPESLNFFNISLLINVEAVKPSSRSVAQKAIRSWAPLRVKS